MQKSNRLDFYPRDINTICAIEVRAQQKKQSLATP